MSSCGLHSAVM